MDAARLPATPGKWETAYILLALLVVTQALEPILLLGTPSDDALTDSSPTTLFSALAIYVVALVFLLRQPVHAVRMVADNPLLVLIFILPLLSVFWSEDPGVSLRRAIALAMTGLFCVYLAIRLSPDEFLRKLLLALFIGGVASLLVTAAFPGIAIEHSSINTGSWKGVYGHKAILGRIAAVAVMVSIYVRPKYRWERIMRWATVAIFLFLSIESQSRASWLMLLAGLGFVLILWVVRAERLSTGLKVGIAAIIALALLLLAVASFDMVLSDFGRDDTFSGRTKLWQGAIAVAEAKHPILGAGYRAFWTESGASGVRSYILSWARLPAHGHNGYLDVWLEMGIPGLVAFAAFLVMTTARLAVRVLREPHDPSWAAFSVFLFLFILNNVSVTVAFKHTDIAWVFAVLAALYAHNSASAAQPARARFAAPHGFDGRVPSYAASKAPAGSI